MEYHHKKIKKTKMINEKYLRREQLPLKMWYDAWVFKTQKEQQLKEAKKKFNNINKDKL